MRHLCWLVLGLFLLSAPAAAATRHGTVSWVYDGDTLKVKGVGKVRLLGIDTPEREPSSRDAYYVKRYDIPPATLRAVAEAALRYSISSAKNREVILEFDDERVDKYGRVLAYLYLPDGRMLNLLLIQQGLAAVYRRFDFREKPGFLRAEKQARKEKLGLWSNTKFKD